MLRATLKSLLARKLRLTLSTLAVVPAVMFVSGALVRSDTLGRAVDNLFANIYTDTGVQVSAKNQVEQQGGCNNPIAPSPAWTGARVAKLDGGAKATGR